MTSHDPATPHDAAPASLNPSLSHPSPSLPLANPDLADAGWNGVWQALLAEQGDPSLRPGRVLRAERTRWTVLDAGGPREAVCAGAFLHAWLSPYDRPAVGDWVALRAGADDPAVIERLLPRRTCIARRAPGSGGDDQVLAANVDAVFVVCGLDGDYNPRRIERYLALVHAAGAEPVVVLTKADLHGDPGAAVAEIAALAGDAAVIAISAQQGTGLDRLRTWLQPGATVALLGSSGAGKSTLANALVGAPLQAVGAVRDDDSRGRHTTTSRVLLPLPGGGALLDAPGLREIQLIADEVGLGAAFADLAALAARCRFRDCRHEDEPGCAVLAAIDAGDLAAERLLDWRKLEREMAHEARKADSAARERERKRNKAFARMAEQATRDQARRRWGR